VVEFRRTRESLDRLAVEIREDKLAWKRWKSTAVALPIAPLAPVIRTVSPVKSTSFEPLRQFGGAGTF
jgi:hypothetical protein